MTEQTVPFQAAIRFWEDGHEDTLIKTEKHTNLDLFLDCVVKYDEHDLRKVVYEAGYPEETMVVREVDIETADGTVTFPFLDFRTALRAIAELQYNAFNRTDLADVFKDFTNIRVMYDYQYDMETKDSWSTMVTADLLGLKIKIEVKDGPTAEVRSTETRDFDNLCDLIRVLFTECLPGQDSEDAA